jgi:hypothetical protein
MNIETDLPSRRVNGRMWVAGQSGNPSGRPVGARGRFSTRKCSRENCGNRFTLTIRAGRNSDKAMAGRKRTYHQGQRYCSATCRKLASKARRAPLQASPQKRPKTLSATTPSSSVTSASISPTIYTGQKSGRARLQMALGRCIVVPDPDLPKMYRAMRPDGSLTDMVNLTRARDAAHLLFQENQ